MKLVFLAFFLLNFCQPKADTLQLLGVVPEKSVVHPPPEKHYHFSINPRKNCRVYWAKNAKKIKWQQVHKPTTVKSSCHVKVAAL